MNEETSVATEPNLPGEKPKETNAPKRVWFPDEEGFTGRPIEYDGQKFYPREVPKSGVRQYVDGRDRISRELQLLGIEQEKELRGLQRELDKAYALAFKEYELAIARGDDANEPEKATAELSADRVLFYESEGERLMDEVDKVYNAFLGKGIVGWDLPRPFTTERLFSLEKVDRLELCEILGARSTGGFQAAKKSQGR